MLAILLLLATVLEFTSIDRHLADALYQYEGGSWSLRHSFLLQTLLHDSAKKIVSVFLIGCLFFSIYRAVIKRPIMWLNYFVITAITITAGVSTLKHLTHVSCPWDLVIYGGHDLYIRSFAALPEGVSQGQCFPGGHVSVAYSLLGLYFAAKANHRHYAKWLLLGVLCLGVVFDATQQLRGAHFLSHGLWTLIFALVVNYLMFSLYYYRTQIQINEKIE